MSELLTRQSGIHTTGLAEVGFFTQTDGKWVESPCVSFPWLLFGPGLQLHGSSGHFALVRRVLLRNRLFSPRASMWADAGVGALAQLSVCLCLQLPLLSTVRGEVMASCSFFLAASPSGAEPALLGCALQRLSRSPIISVENADIRSNACCATLLVWTATCFSTIESSFVVFLSYNAPNWALFPTLFPIIYICYNTIASLALSLTKQMLHKMEILVKNSRNDSCCLRH